MSSIENEVNNTLGAIANDGAPLLEDRVDRFIKEHRKNPQVKPAAIKAGYSERYAHGNGKQIKAVAEKRLASYLKDGRMDKLKSLDPFFDVGRMLEEYTNITLQNKDYSSKLKAISPILIKHKVIPNPSETAERILPQLIIGIKELKISPEMPEISEKGN